MKPLSKRCLRARGSTVRRVAMKTRNRIRIRNRAGGGPSWDPDVHAWFDAVSWGNADLPQKQAINRFVVAGKDHGWWATRDRIGLLANRDIAAAMTCLKSRTVGTPMNLPTFTQWQDVVGNGTSSYINTGYNPAVHGVNWTLNAASMGCFVRTVSGPAEVRQIAASGSDGGTSINIWWGNNMTYASLNTNDGGAGPRGVLASRIGMFTVNRSASNASQLYQDGVQRFADPQNSLSIPNLIIALLASNGGSPAQFSNAGLSLWHTGGSMTAIENADFAADVSILRTAIGW